MNPLNLNSNCQSPTVYDKVPPSTSSYQSALVKTQVAWKGSLKPLLRLSSCVFLEGISHLIGHQSFRDWGSWSEANRCEVPDLILNILLKWYL